FDVAKGVVKELAGEEWVDTVFGELRMGTTKTTFEASRTSERTLDATELTAIAALAAALSETEAGALDAHDASARLAAKTTASQQWLGSSTLPEILHDLRAAELTPHAAGKVDRHF